MNFPTYFFVVLRLILFRLLDGIYSPLEISFWLSNTFISLADLMSDPITLWFPTDKWWIWTFIDYHPITTKEITNLLTYPALCYPHSFLKVETMPYYTSFNSNRIFFPWTINIFHNLTWRPIIWIQIIRTSLLFKLIFISWRHISVYQNPSASTK